MTSRLPVAVEGGVSVPATGTPAEVDVPRSSGERGTSATKDERGTSATKDATEQDAERVRMALCEAGFPAEAAGVCLFPSWWPGETRLVVGIPADVPPRAAWLAYGVANVYSSENDECFACWFAKQDGPEPDCVAVGAFVEDCGADRGRVADRDTK